MRNCRLFSSYSILFNSLNMSVNNMLLRRKTNAKEVVVDKLATKRLYTLFDMTEWSPDLTWSSG